MQSKLTINFLYTGCKGSNHHNLTLDDKRLPYNVYKLEPKANRFSKELELFISQQNKKLKSTSFYVLKYCPGNIQINFVICPACNHLRWKMTPNDLKSFLWNQPVTTHNFKSSDSTLYFRYQLIVDTHTNVLLTTS